ncbi:MarR family transcriptional regulator [Anaerotruncus colihominis]|uniref:MarR family transcriptional regulator n=2 Tax=Anaerotruncus colihominis TaxID=169435 RepID=A0A845RIW6_9FIRM|nr:MarR family transcriptional regulator [Anaerotruncus colihominis]
MTACWRKRAVITNCIPANTHWNKEGAAMHQGCDVWEALRTLDFVRRRALKPRLLALGLTLGEGQPRILNSLLSRSAPMTQRELADACWLDTATLSRTLDRMQAAGLLRRMPDEESRRSYRIVLTEAGREKAAQVRAAFEEADARMLHGFTAAESAALADSLRRAAENLAGGPL